MAKNGKIQKVTKALEEGSKTIAELIELSGASFSTIAMMLNYTLPKKLGYEIKNKVAEVTTESGNKRKLIVFKIVGQQSETPLVEEVA